MIKTLLGTKAEMGQTYVEGTRVPFTRIKVGPCVVTHIKNEEKDGYWAVQLGMGERKLRKTSKALQGHLKRSTQNLKTKTQNDKTTLRYIKEVRLEKDPELKVGDQIKVEDVFKRGDEVRVTGTSKGKGFAGVVKRWHFAGGPKTHGQSDRQRAPGSIGLGTTPGRIFKGKKMAGRMGGDTVTVSNLIVVAVDNEKGFIDVSGPVPGSRKTLLMIKKTASGKLEELISEAPQVQVQEEAEEEEKKEVKTEVSQEVVKKEVKEENNVQN